jgi:KaiC/GvpD/RAD55 family RecA-like ATPase
MNSNFNGEPRSATNGAPPANNQQSQDIVFHPATKRDARLRLGIAGPAGSGKTYSLLNIATALGGPIAVVDTEAQSAEKYADLFQFDVLPLTSFNPELVPRIIKAAAEQGYKVLIFDVLSHFWMGADGTRQQVDRVKMRMKDNEWRAWGVVDPIYDAMIQAIVAAPIHILIGLRVKTEWIVVDNKPRRIGLKPEMRDGIEYIVDVFGDMDLEHNLIITKSRCPAIADQVYHKPGRDVAAILKGWLAVAKTTEIQKAVVRARLEESGPVAPPAPPKPPSSATSMTPQPAPQAATDAQSRRPWTNAAERNKAFADVRERVGETRYDQELEEAGGPAVFRMWNTATAFYRHLCAIALQEVA